MKAQGFSDILNLSNRSHLNAKTGRNVSNIQRGDLMLYNYKEAIDLYGNDYNLKKAIFNRKIFKIEKGIYSDGKSNFTLIELVLKRYNHAFLVKDSALHLIGFIKEEPEKIHLGTARNALRIKDSRIQQHFYSNLDVSIFSENEWHKEEHFLSYENVKRHTTENNNEIRLFNLKALFFDVLRNYKSYKKEFLFEILDKFKNCAFLYDLDEWGVEHNLRYENVISDIEFLDDDLYGILKDIFSEVWHREFKIKYDL